jgi:hypothetical protein
MEKITYRGTLCLYFYFVIVTGISDILQWSRQVTQETRDTYRIFESEVEGIGVVRALKWM